MRLICTSHSPLLLSVMPRERHQGESFFAALEKARREIVEYEPEIVVIFGPDHFNGFFYNVMPPFCVGLEANVATDWDIEEMPLKVPAEAAHELVRAVWDQDIDLAVSFRMTVDHGFTIPLRYLLKRTDAYPTIPIFINCNAAPRSSCRRARLLGTAVGRHLYSTGKRTLIIGSGGISHDPPHPPYEKTSRANQEVLLGVRRRDRGDELARQDRVKKAATELLEGKGPSLPPNPIWDREVLGILSRGELEKVDHFADDWISQEGGSGGHEIRCWIAAFAALAAAGSYTAEELYYAIVTDWITGMAVYRATSRGH